MAGSSSLHHELAALRAELGKISDTGSRPRSEAAKREGGSDAAETEAPSAFTADLEEQLSELTKALSEYTGDVEDFIAEHPLASVLGAFVIGLALGRMMGRA
jgi:ElaB/YqjD/DUF883 family membrane-anchored ribosome-binding protein